MLNFMRNYFGKWVLIGVVGAIALVFVFFGVFPEMRNGGRMGGGDVANVGGERISLQELQNSVNREMEMYKSLGGSLPDSLMQSVRQQALSGLVQQKLFLVEARRMGIFVSDQEVAGEIQNLPYFLDKDSKKFSVELYKRILSQNNLSPGSFEAMVRDTVVSRRLMSFLESRIRVSDAELRREYELTGETRNLQFVRFTRETAYKKMHVAPEEVKKFLADPAKVNMIQTYYAQNNQKYNKQEEVCARHILRKFPKPLSEGAKAPAAPAEFASLKLNAKNFEEVARNKSDDPGSKEQGGDLGCFQKGVMDKEFEKAAWSTAIGQISKPAASRFGWHYIYVYKKNAPISITLDKARNEIAEELLKKERMDDVRKINREMAEAAAKSWPPKADLQTTGNFNRLEGFIPKIGRADEIINAAFDPSSKLQHGPQIFEAQGAFIVASLKDKKSADLNKFTGEREILVKTLRARKMQAFMPAWMEDVRSRTSIKMNESLLRQM